ncbi:hypothetical protein HMF3257_11800 [Spirosoma telluris]|uniref:Uncharacterized protein n=1 Tax=Spirosoma telluris TaxID=2183553 RepID=A0A327NLG1_9BACT|nr:hypothetical protein HMF3257_11800 [Spirosoma telluris]
MERRISKAPTEFGIVFRKTDPQWHQFLERTKQYIQHEKAENTLMLRFRQFRTIAWQYNSLCSINDIAKQHSGFRLIQHR